MRMRAFEAIAAVSAVISMTVLGIWFLAAAFATPGAGGQLASLFALKCSLLALVPLIHMWQQRS